MNLKTKLHWGGFTFIILFCVGTSAQPDSTSPTPAPWALEYQEVQIHPADVEARLTLAEKYLASFEFELAYAEFQQVLSLSPANQRALRAVEQFEKKIEDASEQLHQIELFFQNNAIETASQKIQEMMRSGYLPDELRGKGLLLQGLIRSKQGFKKNALDAWIEAVYSYAGSPSAASAAYLVASSFIEQKDCDAAAQWIRQQQNWWKQPEFEDSFTFTGFLLDQCYGRPVRIKELDLFAQSYPSSSFKSKVDLLLQEALSSYPGRQSERVNILLRIIEAASNSDETKKAIQILEDICRDPANREAHQAIATNINRIVSLSPETTANLRLNICKALLHSFAKSDYSSPEEFVEQYSTLLNRLKAIAHESESIQQEVWIESLRARLILIEKLFLGEHEVLALRQTNLLIQQATQQYEETGNSEVLKILLTLARVCNDQGHPTKALQITFGVYGNSLAGPLAEQALYQSAWLARKEIHDLEKALSFYSIYAHAFPSQSIQEDLTDLARIQRLGFATVKQFQRETGLTVDGKVGRNTRSKIHEMENRLDLILPQEIQGREPSGRDVRGEIISIANEYNRGGQYREAIRTYCHYATLFTKDSNTPKLLLEAGKIFMDSGLYAEAMSLFDEISEEYNQGQEVIEAGLLAAACLENLGLWETAVYRYDVLLKRFPRNAEVRETHSRREAARKIIRFEEFIKDTDKIERQAEARVQIARILNHDLKNPSAAHADYLRAFQIQPEGDQGQVALVEAARIAMKTDLTLAREDLKTLLQYHERSPLADDALLLIGQSYEMEAEQIFEIRYDDIVATKNKIKERMNLYQDTELRELYANVISQISSSPQQKSREWQPTVRWDLDENPQDRANQLYQQAISEYRRIHEQYKIGDQAGTALLRIAVISREKLRNPKDSIAAYELLLKHYPESGAAVDALYGVGSYYKERKQYENALKAFESFVYNHSGDNRAHEAYFAIGECLEALNRYKESLEYYQNYSKRYPRGSLYQLARERSEWIQTYRLR